MKRSQGIVLPDKMRLSSVQSGHQVVELLLVEGRHGFSTAFLLLSARILGVFSIARLSGVLPEDFYN